MAVVALEAKPSWSSLVWMDISLVLVSRHIGAVLAVGTPEPIGSICLGLSPSQVLQAPRKTLQQLLWRLHQESLLTSLNSKKVQVNGSVVVAFRFRAN